MNFSQLFELFIHLFYQSILTMYSLHLAKGPLGPLCCKCRLEMPLVGIKVSKLKHLKKQDKLHYAIVTPPTDPYLHG